MHAIQLPDGHSHRNPWVLKQLLVNEPLHRWCPGGQPTPGQLEQRLVGPQSQLAAACAGLAPTASAASPVVPPMTTRRSASLRFTFLATRSVTDPIRSSTRRRIMSRLSPR
jgi:hypothetical protein